MLKKLFTIAAVSGIAISAQALTPTLDGVINSGEYDSFQAAVQTTQTGFGNNVDSDLDSAGGGELDSLSIADDANFLYLGITGNMENNGNPIVIFLDLDNNIATGASTIPANPFSFIVGTQLPIGAELVITPNAGNDVEIFCNVHTFGGTASSDFMGSTGDTGGPAAATTGSITNSVNGTGSHMLNFALDNSNVAGVAGGSIAPAGGVAAAVSTGLEIAIPKSLLDQAAVGSIGANIGIYVAYTSSGGFFSNQFLPGLATPGVNVGNSPNLSGEAFVTYAVGAVPVELSTFEIN